MQRFQRVSTWIFDLDNTLYPAECNLFAQMDVRMGEFIARYLDIPFEEARYLQKHYYRKFGTTLNGLMNVHRLDPKSFLEYVHDLDLAPVAASPALDAALALEPDRFAVFGYAHVPWMKPRQRLIVVIVAQQAREAFAERLRGMLRSNCNASCRS